MTMRSVRSMASYPLLSVLAFIVFVIHIWSTHDGSTNTRLAVHSIPKENRKVDGEFPPDFEAQIRNETLGFQRVFVISLPERSDRLDAFTLISSLTGFKAELAPGIDGSQVPNKSLPTTEGLRTDDMDNRNAVVGTWRAHLNLARRVVHERLSTALIIEDDSDWDISLKDRLVEFGFASRHFSTKSLHGAEQTGPYGNDWDLLWLGHCAVTECTSPNSHTDGDPSNPHPTDTVTSPQQRYLLENDASVPRPANRLNFATIPDLSSYPNTTRAVFRAENGLCLYAYALSYRGAQKILRAQALLTKWLPIDLGIGEMCADQSNPFNCIGVFPQLFDSHKMAGAMFRDSNIDRYPADKIRKTAYTANIVYSSRINVDRLLRGEEPVSQWPNDPPVEVEEGGVRHNVVELEQGKNPNIMAPNAVFQGNEQEPAKDS